MTREQKYCTVCKSPTHYTKDCWGLGTVCVGSSSPDPIFRGSAMQFPTARKAMSPELQSAIDKITGGDKQ